MSAERTDVVVVGAGPAGLTAARALAERTDRSVLVLEREAAAGGIPRHSDHLGYGVRDKHSFTTGPRYARRLVAEAQEAGVRIETGAMVTGWAGERSLWVTSPAGRRVIEAGAVLLATGARERPRPARMIPGGRPAGVYTTGELQNLVHVHHRRVGERAVVIGAELVSWSAVMTLREAGCDTALLVTRHRKPESYALFSVAGRIAFRTRVATGHRVVAILGRERVTGVEIEDLASGIRQVVACDTVITTGDWIPDHELARLAGASMDAGSRAPVVDTVGRTDVPGVFAAGNLVHPVDTADVAALGGGHVARALDRYLAGALPPGPEVTLRAAPPFAWVSPGRLPADLSPPARGRLVAWVTELIRAPRVTVRQNGRLLAQRRIPWPASPGRAFRLPWELVRDADPAGGPVELSL